MHRPKSPWLARSLLLAQAVLSLTAIPPEAAFGAAPAVRSITLSDAQWATLERAAAQPRTFATALQIDGLVQLDDSRTVPVYSPVTGQVTRVLVSAGDRVRAGQPLAEVAGAEAAQAVADLATARATQRATQAALAVSRQSLQRQQGLLDAGGGTAKDLAQARADLATAESAAAAADAAVAAVRTRLAALGLSPDTPAGPMLLRAPVDAVVVQRQVAAGQLVGPLSSASMPAPLFVLSDLQRVWVTAAVAESDAARVRAGMRLEISAGPGMPVREARVDWVAPMLDPATRRLAIRSVVDHPGTSLRPMGSVRLRLLDGGREARPAIPDSAVIREGESAHCYVVTGARQLTMRALRTGRSEGGLTEVLDGLRPGEVVVGRGALFLDGFGH